MTSQHQDDITAKEGDKPSFLQDVKDALNNRCPRCKKASIYETRFSLNPRDKCPECEFNLSAHDNGDGPAVFIVFVLSFLLVPLALLTYILFSPPMWFNNVFWCVWALVLSVVSLRPLKAYIMLLQYRHLPKTFDDTDQTD
jgi:uncharacterized protein (DUF983 family)